VSNSPFLIKQVNHIPGFVAQMHRCAVEGGADKYLSRAAKFEISDADRATFPDLEDAIDVTLIYTLSTKGE